MKLYTAVVNVENLEATPFLVINLYDKYLVDSLILPYESPEQAIERIKELLQQLGCSVLLLTSHKDIYALTLSEPGIRGMVKRYEDTKETASSLKDAEEVLRDLYDISPIVPLPELPNWRQKLYLFFVLLTYKIGGSGNYEI